MHLRSSFRWSFSVSLLPLAAALVTPLASAESSAKPNAPASKPAASAAAAPASSAAAAGSAASKSRGPAAAAAQVKYGALAIDRNNGFYYGFAHDQPTLAEAEERAVAETEKRGGKGWVVLTWSGVGCAAYRTVAADVGTAYGWGVAATKAAADAIAQKEALERSSGKPVPNHVWACNDAKSGELRTIYDELALGKPAPVPFNDPVKGLYGYKRADGTVLLEPQFTRAEEFDKEGLARVEFDGPRPRASNFIDRGGKLVLATSESGVRSLGNGLFSTGTIGVPGKEHKYGLFDRKTGKQLLANEYYNVWNYSGAPAGKTRIYARKLGSVTPPDKEHTGKHFHDTYECNAPEVRVQGDMIWWDVDLTTRTIEEVKREKMDEHLLAEYFI